MAYNNEQKAAVKFYWYSVAKANDQSIDAYKKAFESYINGEGDDRDPNGIYFLPVTQEIYANGVYFGVDDTMFKGVQSTIGAQGVEGDTLWGHIEKLETTVGDQTQISEAIIKVLSEVALKLDGRNIANAPNGAQALAVSLKTSYNDTNPILITTNNGGNLTAAINLLSTAVSEIQTSGLYEVTTSGEGSVVTSITGVTNGVQGILGTLNSTQIVRTEDAKTTLAGATVEEALTGLQGKIDPAIVELAGTQSRIGAQYSEIKGWQHNLTEQVNSKISIGTNTNATGAFSTTPPNELTDGDLIAKEINDAVIRGVQRVIGIQGADFWGQQGYQSQQNQTLFDVANKLAAVTSAVNTLSGGQGQNIADVIELINQIKTELADPVKNTSIKSVLDNLFPLISNAGYQSNENLPIDGYQWSVNGTTQRNLKDIISALETEISGAQAGAQAYAISYTNDNTVKKIKASKNNGVDVKFTEGTDVDGYQKGAVGFQVVVNTSELVTGVQNSNNKVLNGESYTVNSALTTLDTGIGGVQTQVDGVQTSLQNQIDTIVQQGLTWTVIDSINQNSNQNP